jgi:hypothetical protein
MNRSKQDVVGEKCITKDAGELSLSDEKIKTWAEHYARLLHVEFKWPSDRLPKDGSAPPVTLDIICKAIRKMERGKAAGPSGVTAEC